MTVIDRQTDDIFQRTVEGLLNSELEKPLTVQNLINYCENTEYNHERSADNRLLISGVSQRSLRVLPRLFWDIKYYELRISLVLVG